MELQGFSATQKQAHPVYCLFIHFSFQVNKSRILLWQRMSGETPSYFISVSLSSASKLFIEFSGLSQEIGV